MQMKKKEISCCPRTFVCFLSADPSVILWVTCNGSVDPVVGASVECQTIVDQLPKERKHAKEGSKSQSIRARECVLSHRQE